MGETDLHRSIMFDAIESLKQYYQGQQVYVSGNILLFYQQGNRRRHVSPDVLVVKGLEQRDRKNYLVWEEGRPPHVVIEVTSDSTREEDIYDKFEIYRDKVRVAEYFLFDPRAEYLQPALQGYRLEGSEYRPIIQVAGRLPSRELNLHLEECENHLRFFDPATGGWVPTLQESRDAAIAERQQAEMQRQQAEEQWRQSQAELEELRRELESLRQRLPKSPGTGSESTA
jgi:Uma2 family endonuclease